MQEADPGCPSFFNSQRHGIPLRPRGSVVWGGGKLAAAVPCALLVCVCHVLKCSCSVCCGGGRKLSVYSRYIDSTSLNHIHTRHLQHVHAHQARHAGQLFHIICVCWPHAGAPVGGITTTLPCWIVFRSLSPEGNCDDRNSFKNASDMRHTLSNDICSNDVWAVSWSSGQLFRVPGEKTKNIRSAGAWELKGENRS